MGFLSRFVANHAINRRISLTLQVNCPRFVAIETLPFNSGYFMSFRLNGIDAETLRKKLLSEKGIGTVSIDSRTLRVAFSSIDENKIESVYTDIYAAADEMHRAL